MYGTPSRNRRQAGRGTAGLWLAFRRVRQGNTDLRPVLPVWTGTARRRRGKRMPVIDFGRHIPIPSESRDNGRLGGFHCEESHRLADVGVSCGGLTRVRHFRVLATAATAASPDGAAAATTAAAATAASPPTTAAPPTRRCRHRMRRRRDRVARCVSLHALAVWRSGQHRCGRRLPDLSTGRESHSRGRAPDTRKDGHKHPESG